MHLMYYSMRVAIILAITAIILSIIAIWLSGDWNRIYKDCDKQKQDCYKACKETKDAARSEVNREIERLDSLIEFTMQDTNSTWISVQSLQTQRDRLADDRLDIFIDYLKCKERCEEQWEECVGED